MSYQPYPGQVTLDFSSGSWDSVPNDISAAASCGKTLWLVSDEGAWLDRLTEIAPQHYGQRKTLPVDEIFARLADGEEADAFVPGGEMDLEGLSIDRSESGETWLWLVGSHSRTRRDPEPETRSRKRALKRLAKIDRPSNRFILGRLPLSAGEDGTYDIAPHSERAKGQQPEILPFDLDASVLATLLEDDPHLAPFLALPSKENGLDIEGIVARGERVFLGCRGPVLRGYAVIIELALKSDGGGLLKPRKLEGGRRYRKYFLPLHGLGTRSLMLDGEDLLILAGPTMPFGVPARIYRWRGALARSKSAVIPGSEIGVLSDLPAGLEDDQPEAITEIPTHGGGIGLLVVHDTPAPERVDPVRMTVIADLIGGQSPAQPGLPATAPASGTQDVMIAEGVQVQYQRPRQ